MYPGEVEDSSDYKILETDYENYAIVFTCEDGKERGGEMGHQSLIYLLSRTPDMDKESQQTHLDKVFDYTNGDYDPTTDMHATKHGWWCSYPKD